MGLTCRPMHSPCEGLWLCSPWTAVGGWGTQVPFLGNVRQRHEPSTVFLHLVPSVPGSGGPESSALQKRSRPRAAAQLSCSAQPSEVLNSSHMSGVAKGWMSWMRSSRCVCWALMLRSSVSVAITFRNRNLQASQRTGWRRSPHCPSPATLGLP